MNAPTVRHKYVLNEIDIDRSEFSICPSCAAQVIKLADGCGICGGREEDKLLGGEEELLLNERGERSSPDKEISIPCTIKQPLQPEIKGVIKQDLGDRFLVEVDDNEISVSKAIALSSIYPLQTLQTLQTLSLSSWSIQISVKVSDRFPPLNK